MVIKESYSQFRQKLNDGTSLFEAGGYLMSFIYILIIIIPLYYVFVSSFKDNMQIFRAPLALPSSFGIQNFLDAEKGAILTKATLNSIIVTGSAELLTLFLAFPAAYGIARIKSPLAGWIENIFNLGFLIPAFAMLVPIVLIMAKLGIIYKPLSLILFYSAWRLPMTIVILASYLRTIPRELEESAEIDGATRFQAARHILFPLASPGVITVLIVNFISFWNEFLFALILVNQKDRTMQVALAVLKGEYLVYYGILSAGIVISILPAFIVFIIFQEQLVEGLFVGAVKG